MTQHPGSNQDIVEMTREDSDEDIVKEEKYFEGAVVGEFGKMHL